MMKRILLIICVILFISSVAEAEVIVKTIEPSFFAQLLHKQSFQCKKVFYENGKEVSAWYYDKDDNLINKTGKVPDGIVREYYSNKVKSMEASFKNGMLNGPLKSWRENGVMEYEVTYINDKLNGPAKEYYENGVTNISAHYRDDAYDGLVMTYYENGLLKSTEQYKDGIQNGTTIELFQSGNIKNIFDYKVGEIVKKSIRIFDVSGKSIRHIDIPLIVLIGFIVLVIAFLLDNIRSLPSYDGLYQKANIVIFGYIGYLASLAMYYYFPDIPHMLGDNLFFLLILLFGFINTIMFHNMNESKLAPIKIAFSHLILIFFFIGGWSIPLNDYQLIYLYVLFGSQLFATGLSLPNTVIWNWIIFIPAAGLYCFGHSYLNDSPLYYLFPWEHIFNISNWFIVCYLGATAYYAVMKKIETSVPPRENVPVAYNSDPKEPITSPVSSMRILVVDDMLGVVESFKEILKIKKYYVQATTNPKEGLAILAKEPFDLLILNLMMPEMNGMEFLRAINGKYPNMQRIMVTAYATEGAFTAAIALGCMEYLRKPFLMGEVYTLVDEAIKKNKTGVKIVFPSDEQADKILKDFTTELNKWRESLKEKKSH